MKSIIRVMCAAAFSLVYGSAAHAQTAASAASAYAPVHVVNYYEVLPGDQAPAHGARPRQIFANYVDSSRQEAGALSFEVLHDVEKHNRYVVLEVWRDRADFQQHMHATSTSQLAQALQPWLLGTSDQRINTELQ